MLKLIMGYRQPYRLEIDHLPEHLKTLCNWFLFLVYGISHTVAAQRKFRESLFGLLGANHQSFISRNYRVLYVACSAIGLGMMPLLWQRQDGFIWSINSLTEAGPLTLAQIFSLPKPALAMNGGLAALFLAGIAANVARFDAGAFLGVSEEHESATIELVSATPQQVQSGPSVRQRASKTTSSPAVKPARPSQPEHHLITTGSYALSRHPMYTCLLLMIFVTPDLARDRAMFGFAVWAYLVFIGIPAEERKLLDQFGPVYRIYQRNTPAVIPTGNSIMTVLGLRPAQTSSCATTSN